MKLPAMFAVLLALAPSHAALAQLAPANEAFMKNLEASGIAIDRPYRVRRPGEARTALGYVVDPWGTAIEMTEYLAPDPH